MRIAIVLNPGSGSIGDPDALVADLRRRCDALTVHAPGEHEAAIGEQPDRLLVAGGDGTIASCFQAAATAGIPLGVLPAGTANDFARALGLPLELGPALELATGDAPKLQRSWGGLIDDRPFVNVASVGLAVDAAERAERFKKVLGPLAYSVGAAAAGLAAKPLRASLKADGEPVADGHVWQLLIGASGRFGGGAGLGEADAADRELVAAWVHAGPRITLPVRAAGLRNRTIEQQDGVEWWPAHEFTVTAGADGRPAHWNVDGERWRAPSPCVTLRPLGPADVIVPSAAE